MNIRRAIAAAVFITLCAQNGGADGISCKPGDAREFTSAESVVRGTVAWSSRPFLVLRVRTVLKGKIALPYILVSHSLCMGDPNVLALMEPGQSVMVYLEKGTVLHPMLAGNLWPTSLLGGSAELEPLQEAIKLDFQKGIESGDALVANYSMDALVTLEGSAFSPMLGKLAQSSDTAIREHALKIIHDQKFWEELKRKNKGAPN